LATVRGQPPKIHVFSHAVAMATNKEAARSQAASLRQEPAVIFTFTFLN